MGGSGEEEGSEVFSAIFLVDASQVGGKDGLFSIGPSCSSTAGPLLASRIIKLPYSTRSLPYLTATEYYGGLLSKSEL